MQIETNAVDVCIIISAAVSMRSHQRWLQIVVPQLEQQLLSMGVGNETDRPNRYCVVQFGGRGDELKGHFILVNGRKFFPASSFVVARRQLKRNGDIADGYEAVEFTLNNAPFRNDTTIKTMLLLISNMGRSVLATKVNLTRDVILSRLLENQVIFDSVVSADFGVITQGSSNLQRAIGLNGYNKSTVVRPNGEFEFINGVVTHTSNEGQTVDDYVTLSLAAGSSSWSIGSILAEEETNVITSFVKAFVAAHRLESMRTVEVCQNCSCADSVGGSIESCQNLVCSLHSDQELCRCLVTREPLEVSVTSIT